MKHYRINKVAKLGGVVVKKRDILAQNEKAAMEVAASDADCPICEVYHAGQKVGSIT